MTADEFAEAFPREGEYVEWKAGTGNRPIQESVVAFSNAEGGVVLIGVDDSGRVVGRELTPGVEDELHQILAATHNPGRYEISGLAVDGVLITVLRLQHVSRGLRRRQTEGSCRGKAHARTPYSGPSCSV